MVMLPNLAPTLFIDATPLALDRQRAIPVAMEPTARRLAVAASEPAPAVADLPVLRAEQPASA